MMITEIPCVRCGNLFTFDEQLAGRKIRCLVCKEIQHVMVRPPRPLNQDPQSSVDSYSLVPETPVSMLKKNLGKSALMQSDQTTKASRFRGTVWRKLIRVGVGESSVLEQESLGLIALSLADLLVTYALLRRGPAFYESNPVAQWFFARWNIAGMALFKFGTMGFVVVIAEIVERHRPRLGRGLLLASCLATAAVVGYGLRLLIVHANSGVPLH